jgi:hypothetical protein
VSTHWFQYLDEPPTGRTLDGENGHVGFISVADIPYQDLVTAAPEKVRSRRQNSSLLTHRRREADSRSGVGATPAGQGA